MRTVRSFELAACDLPGTTKRIFGASLIELAACVCGVGRRAGGDAQVDRADRAACQTDAPRSTMTATGRIHHAARLVSATSAVIPSATTTPAAIRQSSPTTKPHRNLKKA